MGLVFNIYYNFLKYTHVYTNFLFLNFLLVLERKPKVLQCINIGFSIKYSQKGKHHLPKFRNCRNLHLSLFS